MLPAALLAASLGFSVASAQNTHARLGEPDLRSSLGSPLYLRIPIETADPAEEIPATRFSLGFKPQNTGIPFIDSAEVGLEKVGAKYFLVVRTRQSIGEPVIGLVIRERLPEGSRSREFTLFVDPPTLAPVRVETAEPQKVDAIVPPPPPPAKPQPQTVAEARSRQLAEAAPPARDATRARKRARPATPAVPSAQARAPAPAEPVAAPTTPRKAQSRPAPRREARGTVSTLGGPKLSLTLSTDALKSTPSASEETRADLKLRRMLLDMDDLTAALLERQNRISQLEKELAGLSARMAAAETQLALNKATTVAAPVPAQAQPGPAPVGTPATAAPEAVPVPAATPAAELPAPPAEQAPRAPVAKPAPEKEPTLAQASGWRRWAGWLVALAGIAALTWAIRRQLRRRDDAYRLNIQAAEDYVDEVERNTPSTSRVISGPVSEPIAQPLAEDQSAPAEQHRDAPAPAKAKLASPAAREEMHFELPSFAATKGAQTQLRPLLADESAKAKKDETIPPAHHTTRRVKFLQNRYHDIAILNPPLDAPQRLLWQAGTLYGEGAINFAKRLLKYAAYSRQLTEEYWLALFEVLYREKLANEYIINARWFRQHHPRSQNWDEVQRIGYLLDPAEPLFANAAAWSHEAPRQGLWLPSGEAPAKAPVPSTALKLELTG